MSRLSSAGEAKRMAATFAEHDIARICELMFRSAAEGLIVVDGGGTIILVNPRLLELFGYTHHDLLGRSIEMLIPTDLRKAHEGHRRSYAVHPSARPMGSGRDLMAVRKDGTSFPVEVSLNHFELNGTRYVMGLVTDITLRREAEKELQRTNADLEERVERRTVELRRAEASLREALEKEKELNALKSRFVSMASHEFRTPLSTILSSVDLIARYNDGSSNENVDRHITKIRGKVRELTSMLNDLLSLERLEQGQVHCTPSDFDIVHLCIEVIEELRDLARPGQELTYDHSGEERNLFQDKQMLANVLRNLLNNAMKYSPEQRPIDLRTWVEDDHLGIEVRDQGMGIPEEDQVHLFERFFRASNAVTIQGTGLGLNIVKRYLDLMNGSITFTSRPGEGTTFTMRLPLHYRS
ncbi:MAG: PAS domain-containing sensor histidine kinase [Flavobacteriales bacterium]|nr:PAS domain-containing sensor histidine kinase [Flavobacteriales bacterium]